MGDEQPGELGGARAFEVFGETPASAEPCEGTLDNPAFGQELEAFNPERSLDDFDRRWSAAGECLDELFAAIDSIGKDVLKPWEAGSQVPQQGNGTMDILNVGGVNIGSQQEAVGVGHDWRLRPWRRLPASNPRGPPASVVEAVWLMTAAVGFGFRPSFRRAFRTKASTISCHLPVSRQA